MQTKELILVVGSANTDRVVSAAHFSAPGETIIGDNFMVNNGGKGANQAVAAARLGGKVNVLLTLMFVLFVAGLSLIVMLLGGN